MVCMLYHHHMYVSFCYLINSLIFLIIKIEKMQTNLKIKNKSSANKRAYVDK